MLLLLAILSRLAQGMRKITARSGEPGERAQRRDMELLFLEGVWKENPGESTSLPRRNVTSQSPIPAAAGEITGFLEPEGVGPGKVGEEKVGEEDVPGGMQALSKGLMGTVSR